MLRNAHHTVSYNMSPKVVFLSAKRRAGKDTLANYMQNRYGFIKVAFADQLKNEVAEKMSINRKEFDDDTLKELKPNGSNYTRRQLLQQYGGSKRREDETYFVRKAVEQINRHLANGRNVVVSDARFPGELEAKGIQTPEITKIRIHRPQRERLFGTDTDISEMALDDYPSFDKHITNEEDKISGMFEQLDAILS